MVGISFSHLSDDCEHYKATSEQQIILGAAIAKQGGDLFKNIQHHYSSNAEEGRSTYKKCLKLHCLSWNVISVNYMKTEYEFGKWACL